GEYAELLAALRSAGPAPAARPYQVSIVGRWSETDIASPLAAAGARAQNGSSLSTPLAGQRCEFEIEDGDGRRRVVLQSVVPGRRYGIGKGEGCDIRVNGTYTSRRHAELWLDKGQWWVADAGSTNGLRVEVPTGRVERRGAAAGSSASVQPVALADGERIVLSAHAEGPPADYPWVMRSTAPAARVTPIATGAAASAPKTPLTAILAAPAGDGVLLMTAVLASGVRSLELHADALPIAVGRSRHQQLVVDRAHGGVSGHHLDIVAVDQGGVQVLVHGDNGVVVEGRMRPPGTRFKWKVGETMVLGAAPQGDLECTLVLSRGEAPR
ncbi:MAG TPA: FHA domain-containing protein, partial [Albitalea sp.]|nr:FHA domain-containing protein [Albitalea sp.]